jgi:hypothetical protein
MRPAPVPEKLEGQTIGAALQPLWDGALIDAARGDPKFITGIRAFWDCHFPFMSSVYSGYAYHAICTGADQFWWVVEGYEPLFEEALPVADSFERFLARFLNAKRST